MIQQIVEFLKNEIFVNGNTPDFVVEKDLQINEILDVDIKTQNQTTINGICTIDMTDIEEDTLTFTVNFEIKMPYTKKELIWGDFDIYNGSV